MINPFVTNGYEGPEYFCDRVRETDDITQLLLNGHDLALISPRRMGKTDLIRHVLAQPQVAQSHHTFIIDIYATNSLHEFVNVFGRAVLEELKPKGRKVWDRFVNALASVRQEITFDIYGQPCWGLQLGAAVDPTTTLDEIFDYLSHADKPCIVAIDEFQQITNYRDTVSVEATLRTHAQRCRNTRFIFSGSQRHLMAAMFTSPSRPFYQSVTIFNLSPIPLDKYTEFAVGHFAAHGKQLAPEVMTRLYGQFEAVTSYLQRMLNVLFMRTPGGARCDVEMIDQALDHILSMAGDTYEMLLHQMPDKQRSVFMAIVADGQAVAVSGGDFVRRHKLQSASSVLSAVQGLLDKDFITHVDGAYRPYDLFFALWLRRRTL